MFLLSDILKTAACVAGVFFCSGPALAQATLDQIVQAKAALLVDADTGRVLFARNIHAQLPPASTTKLMTSLLVYEKTGLYGTVKVSEADTRVEPSHIPLVPGEKVTVLALVKALLIGSDNDAALALARHCSGSLPLFMQQMNARVAELGCAGTVFKNPNGLPSPGQVTTCIDFLKIFQKTIAIPELRQICRTPSYTLTTARGTQIVKNHNKLLGVYPGMGPAKTGWTLSSRHTYAAAASREGYELHLVILNSPNKWVDAKALFDYGFGRLKQEPSMPPVVGGAGARAR